MSQTAPPTSLPTSEWQRPLTIIVAVALGLLGLGLVLNLARSLQAYLAAYLFWLGIGLGSFAILLLHHLTGGRWGAAVRSPLEAATATLPLLALLFAPIALGVDYLYPWVHASADDTLLREKSIYLNVPFFISRAIVYFLLWCGLGWLLLRWSAATVDGEAPAGLRRLSGPGLIVYGLGMTFAAIDWMMSLEPHWFSSIFGVIVVAAQVLSAFAFAVLALAWRSRPEPGMPNVHDWNDLGNLLLAFVMIWTYLSFSQFLLIWSGNLPEEITWYRHRSKGGWIVIAWLLAIFIFAGPFLALLMRDVKRHPRRLAAISGCIIVFCAVHQYWLVAPSFAAHREETGNGSATWPWLWLDVAAFAAIGGVWLWFFQRHARLRSATLAIGTNGGAQHA